jgi:hypothetical protein
MTKIKATKVELKHQGREYKAPKKRTEPLMPDDLPLLWKCHCDTTHSTEISALIVNYSINHNVPITISRFCKKCNAWYTISIAEDR